MRKRLHQTELIRYVVALVIIGSIYGLVFQLPAYLERRSNYPAEQIAAIRAAMAENSVLLSSLATVDGSSSSATETVTKIQSELDESKNNLAKLVNKPPKGLPDASVTQIKSLLDQQEKLIKDYNSRYDALKKPITYDPSEDLGFLDLSDKSEEIAQRAQTASQKLNEFAANPSVKLGTGSADGSFTLNNGVLLLSDETINALKSSAVCLDGVALAASTKSSDLKETIQACDELYRITRRLCLAMVSEVLASEAGQKLSTESTEAIKAIDQLEKH